MFAVAITVIVATIGVVPLFVPVKEGISPEPPAARPIAVLEFVQEYVAPTVGLVNKVPGTVLPSQTTILAGTTTIGEGFTVMVYVEGVPTQPLAEGVTVMVAEIGAVPVFVAVKAGISPVLPVARPIAALLFVHA